MIDLIHKRGFAWYSDAGCHVKGYLITAGGAYLKGDCLLSHFAEAKSSDEIIRNLEGSTGIYSLVLERGERRFLIVDPLRTFPLFYRLSLEETHVSDDVNCLNRMDGEWSLNRAAAAEFRSAGFVTGKETLSNEVFQVEAAQVVELERSIVSPRFYWSYQIGETWDRSFKFFMASLDQMTTTVFRRLVQSLEGRTAVIPLSGGYDSRFIIAMLHQSGYDKLICYSYGREGNREMKLAEQVANQLEIQYIPVIYSEELIDGFEQEEAFGDYVDFSSNFTSMFFLQEYFAVKYLKENRLIPHDAIFIPGHTADFFAGSNYLKHGLPERREPLIKTIRRIHRVKYSLSSVPPSRLMLKRIAGTLREKKMVDGAMSHTVYEDWDLKEKFAKFIGNSCSVYDWFGYEYRLPFFDLEFMNFFRSVPLKFKQNKVLYDTYLKEGLFQRLRINMEGEMQPSGRLQRRFRWRARVKQLIPDRLLSWRYQREDDIFYKEATGRLKQELRDRGVKVSVEGRSYNSLLVQWYLERVRRGHSVRHHSL
ncbi:MAG: asparagine synthase C-terminal domain-containing protein [Bacteroidota bacterium]